MQPFASHTKLYSRSLNRSLKLMRPAIQVGVLLAMSFSAPHAIWATPVTEDVSESGTWGADCPTTFCNAPGDTWSYSFVIDANPAAFNVSVGNYFEAPISDFVFTDNGAVVGPLTDSVTDVYFFSTGQGGGLTDQTGGLILNIYSDQLYAGLDQESSPTIVPGIYPVGDMTTIDGVSPASASALTITPEPSLSIMMAAGLLAIAFVVRKRNARA